jgi:hypothetical protein
MQGIGPDSQKFVLASLAAGAVFLSLGYLFYYVVFADFFAANGGSATDVFRDEPIIWAVLAAQLALGVLAAATGAHVPGAGGMKGGAAAGVALGLLLGSAFALDQYGVTHIANLAATFLDVALWIVRAAAAVAAAAWLLDRE